MSAHLLPLPSLAPTGVHTHEVILIDQLRHASEENPWPSEQLREDYAMLPDAATSAAHQASLQADQLSTAVPETSGSAIGPEEGHMVGKQAITAYLQEMRISEHRPQTLQWHQTSLRALRNAVWRQSHLTGKSELSRDSLQAWLAALSQEPAAQTGTRRTMSTVAAYARSARAFCNWLVQQGYVATSISPPDAVPHVPRGLPHSVEPEAFLLLLRACQLSGEPGGPHAGLTARNRAILWLLLDTGVSVSELCALRIADVDHIGGTVTVRGRKGDARTLSSSTDGQCAVRTYLDVYRLTPAWEPVAGRTGSASAHRTAVSSAQK